jgi:hypothetical protein
MFVPGAQAASKYKVLRSPRTRTEAGVRADAEPARELDKEGFHYFKKLQDGRYPVAGLIFDTAGNLYGTTVGGGDFWVHGVQANPETARQLKRQGTLLPLIF